MLCYRQPLFRLLQYFLMLADGKTMKVVKKALKEDGHDPGYMDQFQFKRVVFSGSGRLDEYKVDDDFDDMKSVMADSKDEDDDDSEYAPVRMEVSIIDCGTPVGALRIKLLFSRQRGLGHCTPPWEPTESFSLSNISLMYTCL